MFLQLLGEVATRFGWSVTAYVLMTNHFHLVIQTPEPNLSRGMQWLNGTYAGWFNRRYGRSGHLFQGRFHAVLVEREAYAAEVLRYVALNPVRARLTELPEAYRWSSYRATAGYDPAPDWLDVASAHLLFGLDTATAQAEYRAFVLARVISEERLWDHVKNAIYLGTDAWTRKMRKVVEAKPRSTDHPRRQRAVGRPKMQMIAATVSRIARLPYETVCSRSGGVLRGLVAWLGWHEGLVTLRSIAACLRLRSEGYVSTLIRRCERQFSSDAVLLGRLDAALAQLRV